MVCAAPNVRYWPDDVGGGAAAAALLPVVVVEGVMAVVHCCADIQSSRSEPLGVRKTGWMWFA